MGLFYFFERVKKMSENEEKHVVSEPVQVEEEEQKADSAPVDKPTAGDSSPTKHDEKSSSRRRSNSRDRKDDRDRRRRRSRSPRRRSRSRSRSPRRRSRSRSPRRSS